MVTAAAMLACVQVHNNMSIAVAFPCRDTYNIWHEYCCTTHNTSVQTIKKKLKEEVGMARNAKKYTNKIFRDKR